VGEDVTDTKTLVAALAWLPATWMALRKGHTRIAAVAGWLVMMAVFMIPHSVRGSQIDWSADEPGPTPAAEGYQPTSTRRGVPPNLATSTHRFRLPNS
jgi:hypothetical protein